MVQERIVEAWTRLAVMEIGKKEWKCDTEAESAGFPEGQTAEGKGRKRLIQF